MFESIFWGVLAADAVMTLFAVAILALYIWLERK